MSVVVSLSLNAQNDEILPEVEREFRGAWIATVNNLDWPTQPSLPSVLQQQELVGMLDFAVENNLNAIVFQVRPAADAFYDSSIAPWSSWLTGTQGVPPQPHWDPLSFVVDEAHKRGLELHAWINPFRVGYLNQTHFDERSILRTHPDLVQIYGNTYWLDPGRPESRAYVRRIVLEIVARYDIDAIHFDDYFYPYPIGGQDFPDEESWRLFGNGDSLDDWRRQNIDTLVRQIGSDIKRVKPHVLFGISPFAIWRNNIPSGVRGLDSYSAIYTDTRKWYNSGWVDYMTPQFYWEPDEPLRPYKRLFQWWVDQNRQDRFLYSGINIRQLNGYNGQTVSVSNVTRKIVDSRLLGGNGQLFFSLGVMMEQRWSVLFELCYPHRALPPATVWLNDEQPVSPVLSIITHREGHRFLSWRASDDVNLRGWVIYRKYGNRWDYELAPTIRNVDMIDLVTDEADAFAIAAIDRYNNIGRAAFFFRDENKETG